MLTVRDYDLPVCLCTGPVLMEKELCTPDILEAIALRGRLRSLLVTVARVLRHYGHPRRGPEKENGGSSPESLGALVFDFVLAAGDYDPRVCWCAGLFADQRF